MARTYTRLKPAAPTTTKIPERSRRALAAANGAIQGCPPVVIKCADPGCLRVGTVVFRSLDWRWPDGNKPASLVQALNLQIDHIHPRLHGGTHDVENLQFLCPSCNARKGAHL